MRGLICLIPMFCGCSTPLVRCEAHLLPINPPAAPSVPAASVRDASVKAAVAPKVEDARSAP